MFENYDFEYIMDKLLERVSDNLDKREGSIIYDALAPAAWELSELYTSIDMVMDETFADTASYYYLIKRAAERGLLPREATKALCKMVVTPTTAAISIDDRFALGDLNYSVTSIIDASQGKYQLTCETEGTAANQQTGELLPIETANELNDLESAVISEVIVPGEDEEEEEDFRERYFNSFDNEAFGGNKADYIEKVDDINGVGGCKVFRRWQTGYNPVDFVPVAAVTTWYNSVKDSLSDTVKAWLVSVYEAAADRLLTVGGTVEVVVINSDYEKPSSSLIETIQTAIDPESTAGEGDGIAPIGHVVTVKGVEESSIDIDVSGIEYKSGYSFSNMKSTIEGLIDTYFLELSEAWKSNDNLIVRISQIETRLLDLKDEIADVSGVKLNDDTENITLDVNQIPVRGDLDG